MHRTLRSSAGLAALLLSAGCTLLDGEPPCHDDDNCAGERRCDAETRRCVSPVADGGVDDDGPAASE